MLYLFLGSTALVVIGSFLPWINLEFNNVSGIDSCGLYTLMLAIINVIVYFGVKDKYVVVTVITTIIGLLILVIVLGTSMRLKEVGFGSPGVGLIMTLIGSSGIVLYGINKR